jgi:hypothetical protein
MAEPTGIARPHINPADVASYATGHPLAAVAAAALAITAVVIIWRAARAAGRAVRRVTTRHQPDDVLTFVAAGLITGLQSQGMWRFFRDTLHLAPALRIMMFAVFELAMLVCALRARRSVKAGRSAGVDGAAVWSLATLSGVLSATDAWPSFGGVLVRLSAPYAAAFLWERGLSIERRRSGRSTIHWRITPERVLVRLGVAEPTDRTATDVDAHRRLYRVARAAKNLRALQRTGAAGWRQRRALRRLDTAAAAAVEHAGLASDPDRQAELLAQIGVLYGAAQLVDVTPATPWETPARPPRLRLYREPSTGQHADGGPGHGLPFDTPHELISWLDEGRVPGEDETVPPVLPEVDPHHIKAARIFADDVDSGRVPGIRPIKRRLGVGQKTAQEVQTYLAALASL